MLKHRILIPLLAVLLSTPAFADKPGGTYQFDTEGQHQFILFKISHLGYSWLYGNFNEFTGSFTVDEDNPENSKVRAVILRSYRTKSYFVNFIKFITTSR